MANTMDSAVVLMLLFTRTGIVQEANASCYFHLLSVSHPPPSTTQVTGVPAHPHGAGATFIYSLSFVPIRYVYSFVSKIFLCINAYHYTVVFPCVLKPTTVCRGRGAVYSSSKQVGIGGE